MLNRYAKSLTAFLIATLLVFTGSFAMSNRTIELHWEWLAGRKMETKVLVKVENITKVSKGLFGIGGSPSNADALPDPRDLEAAVISGQEEMIGRRIRIRLPGMEANKLTVGDHAALGLISGNTVCSCVAPVPVKNPAAEQTWFAQWTCQQ